MLVNIGLKRAIKDRNDDPKRCAINMNSEEKLVLKGRSPSVGRRYYAQMRFHSLGLR